MSNVYPFPKQSEQIADERAIEQASLWVARIDRELQPHEKRELESWLAEDIVNVHAFLEVAELWDKMDDVQRLSDLFPRPQQPQYRSNHNKLWTIAASVCFTLLLGWLLLVPQFNQQQDNLLAVQHSYQTLVGENNTFVLPDSSEITLNTNTFVQIRFTPNARVIDLQRGEIHIEVAHDNSRPLSVLAAGKVIQAVGTAFSVQMDQELVELIVTDGKVLVASQHTKTKAEPQKLNDQALAVQRGEKVDLDLTGQKTEKVIKLDAADIAINLSWRTGNLIFRGESLEQAMAEIARYTQTKFKLSDSQALRKVKVAGVFKTGDVNGLLSALKHNFNIEAQTLDNGTIYLSPAT
ncbi:FecR family protein [Catenovulum sediminis]|uniref:FecR domain-containing protein n=1 Tax=Catenovulum sediminis TaxID=1740262 RepID=A0ABV1RLT0_9ALTE